MAKKTHPPIEGVISDVRVNPVHKIAILTVITDEGQEISFTVLDPPRLFEECYESRIWINKHLAMIHGHKWADRLSANRLRLVARE